MTTASPYLNPAEAARQLGVSTKALRLYERRGLLKPIRSAAGWRVYGGEAMERAGEIAALRRLGLSLAAVERVLGGDAATLDQALAAHQEGLENQIGDLARTIGLLRDLRARLAAGEQPAVREVMRAVAGGPGAGVGFDLPWPWNGERFELPSLAALTFVVGPLGSGKTRLAQQLAAELPNARFSGLDRAAGIAALSVEVRDLAAQLVVRLVEDGATRSDALLALAAALVQNRSQIMVLDLIEHGLDATTQEVVGDLLRQRQRGGPTLIVMTRSTAILDLDSVGSDTTLLLCPANHSPPMLVTPCVGARGYEALASCLASPEVRARTEGVTVSMPPARSIA